MYEYALFNVVVFVPIFFFGAYNGQGLCNYYQEITRLSYQKPEVRTAHGVNLALL